MLKEIQKFSLASQQNKSKASLIDNRSNTGLKLYGSIIEKQYEYNGMYYVIITSYDVPYEEILSIYFLDNSYHILDLVFISYHYLSGACSTFRNPNIFSSNQVSFNYETNSTWVLTIVDDPTSSFNFKNLGAQRPWWKFYGKQYLKLDYTGDIQEDFGI